jgi:hypothetical protein
MENLKEFVCKFIEKENNTSFPHLYIVGRLLIIQIRRQGLSEKSKMP